VFHVNQPFRDGLHLPRHISDLTQQAAFQNYIRPGTRNNPIRSRRIRTRALGEYKILEGWLANHIMSLTMETE
jgi:hypothetical protein